MAKRVPPLSAAQISSTKPDPTRTIELIDGAVPGLRLRITPSGKRSWSLMVRDSSGTMRRFTVDDGLGLAEARKAAETLRRAIREGADPTEDKRAARARSTAAAMGQGTLRALVETYFETGPGVGHRTKGEQRRRILAVFAKALEKPAYDIKSAQLQLLADDYPTKKSAGDACKYFSPIAKWAHKREFIKDRIELEKPINPAPVKQRVLTGDELRRVLPCLGDAPYERAVRFILWTAVRLSELTEACWREFDLELGTWTIPGERRKDARASSVRRAAPAQDHVIPLPTQAVEMLRAIKGERKPDPTALVFVGERGGSLCNWDRAMKRIHPKSGTSDWSPHALRRTAATAVGELGYAPHVVSVVLGHRTVATHMQGQGGGNLVLSGGALTGRYNKSRYAPEHKAALQAAADLYDQLAAGETD